MMLAALKQRTERRALTCDTGRMHALFEYRCTCALSPAQLKPPDPQVFGIVSKQVQLLELAYVRVHVDTKPGVQSHKSWILGRNLPFLT